MPAYCSGPQVDPACGVLVCPRGYVPNFERGQNWSGLCDYCADEYQAEAESYGAPSKADFWMEDCR